MGISTAAELNLITIISLPRSSFGLCSFRPNTVAAVNAFICSSLQVGIIDWFQSWRCSLSVCLCRCLLRHSVKSTLGTICPSHFSNQLTDPPITIISLYCPPSSSLALHFVLAAPAAHTASTVSAATCSSHCSNQLTIPTCRITCCSLLPLCTQYTTTAL